MDRALPARRAKRMVAGLMVLAWVGFMGPSLIQLTTEHPVPGRGALLAHVIMPWLTMVSVTGVVWIVGRGIQKEIDALAGVERSGGEPSPGGERSG